MAFFHEQTSCLSRFLLRPDGLIFISIDDNEQAHLKLLCDSIFSESNFICCFMIDKTAQGANQSVSFKQQHEYCLLYKNGPATSLNTNLKKESDPKKYKYIDEKGRYACTNSFDSINSPLTSNKNRGYTVYYNEKTGEAKINDEYDHENNGFGNYNEDLIQQGFTPIRPGIRKGVQYPWNWKRERFLAEYKTELVFQKNKKGVVSIYHKNRESGFVKDTTLKKFDTRKNGNELLVNILKSKLFDYPKSLDMMKWIVERHLSKNATVLDFFAGSGTTGQAVLELNKEDGGHRQFILCTNNENQIAEDVTYPRIKTIITGKRADGSIYSDGIPANLRYFKTDFVEKDRSTDATREELVNHSADMIRIRENAYKEYKATSINKYYGSKDTFVAIIFDPFAMIEAWEEIEKLNIEKKPVKLYIFSYSRDTSAFTDEIPETTLEWESTPIPESILQVYKRLFGGKK